MCAWLSPLTRPVPRFVAAPWPSDPADASALLGLDASASDDAAARSDWALDAFSLTAEAQLRLPLVLLHSLGLLRRFHISPDKVHDLVTAVAARMEAQPFHSFPHVLMVRAMRQDHHTKTVHSDTASRQVMSAATELLVGSSLQSSVLRDTDALALLLGALCHDLEHPGRTNGFLIRTRHELALRYLDASPLEHHHASVGLTLIEQTGVLAHLPPDERGEVMRTFVAAILATDSACRAARE